MRDKYLYTVKFATPTVKLGSQSKTDLTDFTFLIPLRIDSAERKANAETVIKFILKYFDTLLIVLECDSNRKFYLPQKRDNLQYEFIRDHNIYFYKTKYINQLITLTKTPFIAVWDTDSILPSEQVIFTANELRKEREGIGIPYDGRVYKCDESLSYLFKQTPDINILLKLSSSLPLMYGYHSQGGAFLTSRESYIEQGGENENFKSWGPEDSERIKRFEVLNLPVRYTEGPLFHLWHPRGLNSWYTSREEEMANRKEFIKTCQNEEFLKKSK
jgi:hypothetical protein